MKFIIRSFILLIVRLLCKLDDKLGPEHCGPVEPVHLKGIDDEYPTSECNAYCGIERPDEIQTNGVSIKGF